MKASPLPAAAGDSLYVRGSWFGVASSPQVTGGIVYFAALDGKVYAVQG
ncbi:MAG: PQQ-binding-like beta-propeller repeat protein [Anaerolineales bacterium]